jgi:hypothetical protein
MFVLLSLVVCLAGQPAICETVIPASMHLETGQPPTLFECLGAGGQDIAHRWLEEHPGHLLQRIQCSMANDPARLRDRIQTPQA